MPCRKLLTVITVCYNEENLQRTCESIVNQSFQDFEWVVIDGGSNNKILEIFNKYKNRINIFVSEKDNGIYDAMNKGIKLAKGEWLNFMNAGDTFFDNKTLEKIFPCNVLKDNKTDILYGDSINYGLDNIGLHYKMPDKLNYIFWRNRGIVHQSAFIKKELFIRFGLYDEHYRVCADFEKFILFFKEKYKFKHLKFPVANYYAGGISSTSNSNSERDEILNKYFISEYETIRTIKLFGRIPVMRIKKRRDSKKCKLVFLKIPLIVWNCKDNKKF